MQHNVSDLTVNQFTRSLKSLRALLVKTKEFAATREFDENNFMTLRLAPDMFPFSRQVQICTDVAKGCVARLSGKTAPSFADDETTVEQLVTRVDKTIDYLTTFKSEDFKDYQTKQVSFPWVPGRFLNGEDFLASHAIPNFYFHFTIAYSILRSNGLPLGKKDYLGEQNWQKQ